MIKGNLTEQPQSDSCDSSVMGVFMSMIGTLTDEPILTIYHFIV